MDLTAATASASPVPPRPSFRELFESEVEYVWRSLRRLGVREADVEDVAHEVFLAVYHHLGDYDPRRPVRPWLFGFALRHALRYRDQARFRRERGGLDWEPVDEMPGPEAQLASAQARQLVLAALEQLPMERRAVFVMAEIEGHGMPEIAAALEIPLNTGYSRLRLARAEFRRAVESLHPPA